MDNTGASGLAKINYDTLILLGVAFIPILCWLVFYNSRRRFNELAALIPGIPGLPIVGNALQFPGNALDITNKLKHFTLSCMKYEGIIKFWLGPVLYVGLINPCDVEIVLNKELNKDPIYRFMKCWVGEGLVPGELSIWKVHRKMLAPSFHQKVLDSFMDIFVEKSQILVKKLSTMKGTFDAVDFMKPCTLDIICESAMGVNINAQRNMNVPYIQAAIGLIEIINRRIYKWWLQPEWLFKFTSYAKKEKEYIKVVHGFTDNVIQIQKKNYYNKRNDINAAKEKYLDMGDISSKRKNFLDLLIELSEEGDRWSDKELRDEVDNMTLGGTDTTAQTVSFALLLLGSHPHTQEKVYNELYEIFGDTNREATKEDLLKMIYLDRVIKETLRLFPIVANVIRQLKQEVKLANYTLPAGAGCVIGIYAIHRDPRTWGENAEDFDPDNFLPEKCAKRHPYSYIPFSAGPRNCIGKQFGMMSMKVILSSVLRSYKVHSEADHKDIWKNEVIFEVFTRPVGGFPISVEPRTKTVSDSKE